VTTLDEPLRALWEPGAATVERRLGVIRAARATGIETSIMFGPLLPYLSDSQAAIGALLERAADLEVDQIWVDALNRRPRVWPAVAELLRAHFPELLPPIARSFSTNLPAKGISESSARGSSRPHAGPRWPTGSRPACDGGYTGGRAPSQLVNSQRWLGLDIQDVSGSGRARASRTGSQPHRSGICFNRPLVVNQQNALR